MARKGHSASWRRLRLPSRTQRFPRQPPPLYSNHRGTGLLPWEVRLRCSLQSALAAQQLHLQPRRARGHVGSSRVSLPRHPAVGGRMTRRKIRPALLLCALGAVLACQDSIVRLLGPENAAQTLNTPELFQFTATEMRNVNEQLTWTWANPATTASLIHDSFIHHGYGVLVVLDGAGQVVDSVAVMDEAVV